MTTAKPKQQVTALRKLQGKPGRHADQASRSAARCMHQIRVHGSAAVFAIPRGEDTAFVQAVPGRQMVGTYDDSTTLDALAADIEAALDSLNGNGGGHVR